MTLFFDAKDIAFISKKRECIELLQNIAHCMHSQWYKNRLLTSIIKCLFATLQNAVRIGPLPYLCDKKDLFDYVLTRCGFQNNPIVKHLNYCVDLLLRQNEPSFEDRENNKAISLFFENDSQVSQAREMIETARNLNQLPRQYLNCVIELTRDANKPKPYLHRLLLWCGHGSLLLFFFFFLPFFPPLLLLLRVLEQQKTSDSKSNNNFILSCF
ncbi:hypothetical protein RFI_13804 [Reticulomyxa filosa]|uniref:Uncharacterized protein n=1 Tax=Reticulomyxa filosa TaxID=46433 RepID=X6NDI6_RETFI|nr:hypothetical protein RFI_13804 [Reticulomyxa filosa]|eukprot:ETO23382.1 hypothetical protein RFI_13804 [Reticulomyxa filosa]